MVNTWANRNRPDKMRENVKNLKKAKCINVRIQTVAQLFPINFYSLEYEVF